MLASTLGSLGYSFSSMHSETDAADLPELSSFHIIILADTVSTDHSDDYHRDLDWALYLRSFNRDCYLLLVVDNQVNSCLCARAIESGINGFINIEASDFQTVLADRIEETLLRFSDGNTSGANDDTTWITNVMGIPARSKSMQDIVLRACRAASLDHPILIEADHTEGPFHLAQAIHKMDPKRSSCPFFAIGSDISDKISPLYPEAFCNSESFSNLINDYTQRLICSGGGTLVFEDLARLTPAVHEKVFHLLETKYCFTRLPSSPSSPVHKIRIIALTSQPLLPKVQEGQFHKELYQYLSQVQLRIPPLSERREDIPLLINYFIQKYARIYDRAITAVVPEVYTVLQTFAEREGFTGLENIIRTGLLLKKNDSILAPADLPGLEIK
jgi:DNA-binding NtrC family response regulator